MTNFPSITDIENMGGTLSTFLFIPCSKINSMVKPFSGKITTAVSLQNGSSWLTGLAIAGTMEFEEKVDGSAHGNVYTPVIKGAVPRLTPEYLALFEEMSNDRFVVIVYDNNGYLYIVGTKEEGMIFKFDRKTSPTAAGLNAHMFEFSVSRAVSSPFYDI